MDRFLEYTGEDRSEETFEPEYARFVGHALLEDIEIDESHREGIRSLEGVRSGDAVIFEYDKFRSALYGLRLAEDPGTDYIAVAEEVDDLAEGIQEFQEDGEYSVYVPGHYGEPVGATD